MIENWNKKHILLGVMGLAAFFIITLLYEMNALYSFDLWVFSFVENNRNMYLTLVMHVITMLSDYRVIVSIILLVLLFEKRKQLGLILASITGVSTLLMFWLKDFFARPRPTEIVALSSESTFSYPSGHALAAMVFYGMILFLIHRNIKDRILSRLLQVMLGILIFLIGISRVYLGVHYMSDVLAGFALGYALLMMGILVVRHFYLTSTSEKYDEKVYNL